MPERPDIDVYARHLQALAGGSVLREVKLVSPFLLRTALPPIDGCLGRRLLGVQRLGKRVVLALDGELYLVIHLMIAGRLQWAAGQDKPGAGRGVLANFRFDAGTLALNEAGTQRRASLHCVAGAAGLAALDPGGIEVIPGGLEAFAQRLRAGNHTLKRALTSPQAFAGIGNAYSDEILHRARLSPLALTRSLDDAQVRTLFDACLAVLDEWTTRLAAEADAAGWPRKVTAFRPEMAVHGRYGQPCPDCAAPVQRIVHGDHEVNYCARCQTGGRLLADRALSRLLKADWPKSIDEL
jgi:formamidopyrimidine-DNA glycosylase